MRLVTLPNGCQVDRRLYWWLFGRITSLAAQERLAGKLGLKLPYRLRGVSLPDRIVIELTQEWMRQAGTPPIPARQRGDWDNA